MNAHSRVVRAQQRMKFGSLAMLRSRGVSFARAFRGLDGRGRAPRDGFMASREKLTPLLRPDFRINSSIHRTTLLLLGCLLLAPVASAFSAGQAERAVALVKEEIHRGNIKPGTILTIAVKQGNINNFWGENYSLKKEWESRTDTLIDTIIIPQQPVREFLRETEGVDLTVARQREYPDLVADGTITDLTELLAHYGFSLDNDETSGYIHPDKQAMFDNRVFAIPADGDIAVLYLRSDLLEDPKLKTRYRNAFDTELTAPATWDEYLRQVQFFHDASAPFYGSCEQRNPDSAWMFWMPRFVSTGRPNRYLFDEAMRPQLDSEEGIRATQNYMDTIAYSPPEILGENSSYSYTLPLFRDGHCYSMIITLSLAKLLNHPQSAVRGKFKIYPMPGWTGDGTLIARTSYIYGNNLVVPTNSENSSLALLYAMWFTDPDISLRSVMVTSGIADPYRFNHYHNALLYPIYTRQALEATLESAERAVPAGTGLPGDSEYISTLNMNLWRASKGEFSAVEAMRRTSLAWEAITEQKGRERQRRYWQQFQRKFPQAGDQP